MDPISQAALGAVVGQMVGHRKLGYRAALVGALAGAAPDIDVVFSIGGDAFDQYVLHRGITHSVFFAPVVGPLLGALIWQVERARGHAPRQDPGRLSVWLWVVTLALLSHPLLDWLTPYGTQLLLPFTDARFAVNAMPIIDPVYTALLGIGLWLAARRLRARARAAAVATLLISTGYLAFAWSLNEAAAREASRQLRAIGVTEARIAAFPTILQIHYRRVVARTPGEDFVGYISMWRPCPIDWRRAASYAGPEVDAFLTRREGRIFDWFTMGWTRYHRVIDAAGARIRALDLRYGFTDDPNHSIFDAYAAIDPIVGTLGPVRAGTEAPMAAGDRLGALLQQTYAPSCQIG